ncbi:hypothetical protein NAPIS_ORF01916 [Vairimorpha apis BRL 01]|uniref:Uncharacterized protein n=1 Tax=Vairimorpha apis BRL 01 TaxID=1037528 RepID=T0KZ44_9MICR|nr:hypothetical protein NAPIS_ORF01916 [Vairimorpha apis BRL 01]
MTRKEEVKFVSETGKVIAEEDIEMNEKRKSIHIKEQEGKLIIEENGELVVEENVKVIKNKKDSSKYDNNRYSVLKQYIPITKKDNLSVEDIKMWLLKDSKNWSTKNEEILSKGREELQDVFDFTKTLFTIIYKSIKILCLNMLIIEFYILKIKLMKKTLWNYN